MTRAMHYAWTRSGSLEPGLVAADVDGALTAKGEVWEVVVTATDSHGHAIASNPASVTVVNSPPVVDLVQTGPVDATANDSLICTATTSDADLDAVIVGWSWTVNGLPHTETSDTLASSEVIPSATVQCTATPWDGEETGSPISGEFHIADNTPPGAPTIQITPAEPSEIDDLVCSVTGVSSDAEGDPVTYSFAWERDEVAFEDHVDGALDSTVEGPDKASAGQVFACTVTPHDGHAEGTPVSASVTIAEPYAVVASAGEDHSCGVTSGGDLWCVGYDGFDNVSDAPFGFFADVAAGLNHSCAIDLDGEIECWGRDTHGLTEVPVGVHTEIGAGDLYSCAVSASAEIICWGDDLNGRVSDAPVGGQWHGLSVGEETACAISTSDGSVTCWGRDNNGQADPPSGVFDKVDIHSNHACGIRADATMECWGADTHNKDEPEGSDYWLDVATGHEQSTGIDLDGNLHCWGLNNIHQCDVPAGAFVSIDYGHNHGCGLTPEGTTECWGSNDYGQLDLPADAP